MRDILCWCDTLLNDLLFALFIWQMWYEGTPVCSGPAHWTQNKVFRKQRHCMNTSLARRILAKWQLRKILLLISELACLKHCEKIHMQCSHPNRHSVWLVRRLTRQSQEIEGHWFRFKDCLGKFELAKSIRRTALTASCRSGAAQLPNNTGI